MELSAELIQGLNYLANGSYISEDNYKKIVNSSLGLLAGESNIERVSTICPEKGEIIKQIYGCLLTFTVEVIRNNALEEVKTLLSKQNFKPDRIDYFIKVLNSNKDSIIQSLENCQAGWPNIVDVEWRLDFVIKTNTCNHIGEQLYYIVLTTEKNGMSEIWNHWGLKAPPICTIKVIVNPKEMENLLELVSDACATLSNFHFLNKEAAILSRLLYRNKRMFRHEKAFQNLSKIHQSLKRYLKLNLSYALGAFRATLPKQIRPEATHAYLPVRQMLKWILLRLLAFSQIFTRLINLTKNTGAYLYKKMHLGWHVNLSLVIYSLTARILVASKFLVLKSIEWYNSLYGYLPHLKETYEFAPEFTFPRNLKKWLGDVDISPMKKKTSIDEVFELIDLVKDEDKEEDVEEEEEDDDVRIINENLFGFLSVNERVDPDIVEIPVNEVGHVQNNLVEDLGVPVREKQERKNSRKNKRQWLGKYKKKMKKNIRKH